MEFNTRWMSLSWYICPDELSKYIVFSCKSTVSFSSSVGFHPLCRLFHISGDRLHQTLTQVVSATLRTPNVQILPHQAILSTKQVEPCPCILFLDKKANLQRLPSHASQNKLSCISSRRSFRIYIHCIDCSFNAIF